ncbi:archease [Micromonospora narathiwatensis]|uniref:SHS2 domain-containing protein n=1 Tax=Micromonospora narathiwatensis TaxID=299146 RepID=A0A1A8ZMF4_9ACTN|nr:archease [Micromonospora narathiwatensis]SBT45067.1 SHS2 domain-containing protein [Micromonospora narathiwatensis]
MERRPARGHRNVPHTADVRIEAWAPDREECVAEAVAAMLDVFVDTAGATADATSETRYAVPPGDDADMLVAVLDEVIFRLETAGVLPLASDVRAADGGLLVRWWTVDADAVELIGAVPKAVSLHELRFGPDRDGWSCAVTLDV